MPEWLAHLLESPIPVLLDLLSNLWWLLGLLLGGLIWAASRLGLWKRCSKQNLKDWIHQLDHDDESKRLEAGQKLIACGNRAISLLVDTLRDTGSDKRRELVIDVLFEIGTPALRPLLAKRREQPIARLIDKALQEDLPKVVERRQYEQEHASAWKRLRKRIARPERQILDELISLLDDDNHVVQEGAALALGQYPRPEVAQALGRKLYPTECGNPEVRKAIADSLGQTKQAEAIPFLEIGLRDQSRDVRIAACQALSQLNHPKAIPGLEETLLPHEDPGVRIEAAKALVAIDRVKAREILGRALQSIPDDDDHRELRSVVGDELAKSQRTLRGEEII